MTRLRKPKPQGITRRSAPWRETRHLLRSPETAKRLLASIRELDGEDNPRGQIARDETFDDFLAEQGLLAEAEERAIMELTAEQASGRKARAGFV